MEVAEIDVQDGRALRAFWEAAREADEFERPYAAFWGLAAMTISFQDPANTVEQRPLAATEDGEVLGTSQVMLPILDNTHVAFVGLSVRPAHRRRGVGTALLEHSLRLARDKGRTTVIIEADIPLVDPPRSAGSDFLERHGFERASLELHRVLELPVAADRLEDLERAAAPHHADYRLVSFAGRVPDDYLPGYCALQGAFNDEAPLGDLDLEAEVWDESRVRRNEARMEKQGRELQRVVAVAPDGTLVGLTELITPDDAPDIGWQSATLVLSAHRGHRLGMAIKVANLRRFQERFPDVRLLHSWNAEENGPMVAINDAIGFRPVEYLVEMQKVL